MEAEPEPEAKAKPKPKPGLQGKEPRIQLSVADDSDGDRDTASDGERSGKSPRVKQQIGPDVTEMDIDGEGAVNNEDEVRC